MIKLLFIFILSFTEVIASDNFMEFGNVNYGRNFKEKSKWMLTLGSETIRYTATLPKYKGEHVDIDGSEVNDLNGYGLQFGRDFYLGKGVSSTIKFGAYYSKTLDKIIGKGARDINIDFSETRIAHQMSAYEGSLGLNYIFDYKVVDVQPFLEFGTGAGQIKVEKQYSRRGFPEPNETNGSEEYDISVTESFAFTRVSLGVNFISYKGLMSYFKVSAMPIVIASRETEGITNVKGSSVFIDVDKSEDSLGEIQTLTMLSVGIGSYF